MRIVFAVETAVRAVFAPDKINLASFGNMAPHLHWHIIPRFNNDAHFPEPVWGKRRRRAATAAIRGVPPRWRAALKRMLVQML
jgi:diadenosine tetraphosphate (Ap4A) HIT family hydrolase